MFPESLLCAGPCARQGLTPHCPKVMVGGGAVSRGEEAEREGESRGGGEESARFKVKLHGQMTLKIPSPPPAFDSREM